MQGAKGIPNSELPLLSRLDQLGYIMQRLEGKQGLSRWGVNNALRCADAQTGAIEAREGYFKGSLLDRVASLESRLSQLCLEIESNSTSCASSSHGSKSEPSSASLPVYNMAVPELKLSQFHVIGPKKQEEPIEEEDKELEEKRELNKESQTRSKKKSRKWLHMRLLGC